MHHRHVETIPYQTAARVIYCSPSSARQSPLPSLSLNIRQHRQQHRARDRTIATGLLFYARSTFSDNQKKKEKKKKKTIHIITTKSGGRAVQTNLLFHSPGFAVRL